MLAVSHPLKIKRKILNIKSANITIFVKLTGKFIHLILMSFVIQTQLLFQQEEL